LKSSYLDELLAQGQQEKRGIRKIGSFHDVIENKWCQNVSSEAFHDIHENTGTYTLLSTISVKTKGLTQARQDEWRQL
jgi:hypothetical protein